MSRIIMAESATDLFRKSIGKAKVVDDYNRTDSRIVNNLSKEFNITFMKSGLVDKGFLHEERSVIKIEPTRATSFASFRSRLNSSIQIGAEYTDHYVSIDQASQVYSVEKEHLDKTITSYNLQTVYNYLSLEYDLASRTAKEFFFPSIMDSKLKTDFLDFKRLGKGSPLYSSDRGAMKKMVIPNMGKDRIIGMNCSEKKSNYPYYNEIQIANKVSNKFTSFMEKTEMFDPFLSDYLQSAKFQIGMNIQDGPVVKKNVQVPYYNAATWAFSDSFQVSKDLHLLDPSVAKQPKMIIDYKKMLFAGYIKSISKRGFRSYKDICGNEECYKEDFIYSVEK